MKTLFAGYTGRPLHAVYIYIQQDTLALLLFSHLTSLCPVYKSSVTSNLSFTAICTRHQDTYLRPSILLSSKYLLPIKTFKHHSPRPRQDKVPDSANIHRIGTLALFGFQGAQTRPCPFFISRVLHSHFTREPGVSNPRCACSTPGGPSAPIPSPVSCPCSKRAHLAHPTSGLDKRGILTISSRSIPSFLFAKTPSNHDFFLSGLSLWRWLTYVECTAP